MTFKGSLVWPLLQGGREDDRPVALDHLSCAVDTQPRGAGSWGTLLEGRSWACWEESMWPAQCSEEQCACPSFLVPHGNNQKEKQHMFCRQQWGLRQVIKKNESNEHITTNRGGWQDSTDEVEEDEDDGAGVTGSSSSPRGDTRFKGTAYLPKLRDTPKDHSFTLEMTGRDLKFRRDAHPFPALMPTGSPWEPHTGLLSRALLSRSAKGYKDRLERWQNDGNDQDAASPGAETLDLCWINC